VKQGTKDFLSVVVPSLQLLLLGILTALFTANIDKFKAGIDESEMINRLVMDLSKDSTKTSLKADFVLLSLERYLNRSHNGVMKEYDRDMLVGFAKSIIINRYKNSNKQSIQNIDELRIPREILLKYNSANVNSFFLDLTKSDITPYALDTAEVKNINIANPVRQLVKENKSEILKVLIPRSVYIQYNDINKMLGIDSLRIAFQEQKWNASSLEFRKGTYSNSIRYFHSEDINLVDEASKILESCHYRKFKIILLTEYKNVPKGQIEIWINNKYTYDRTHKTSGK